MRIPKSPGVKRTLLVRIALIGLAGLVAVSCSSVPGSGPAEDVRQVVPAGQTSGQFTVESGQSQEQIVRNFITASAKTNVDPNLTQARAYLTPAAGQTWAQAPTGITLISSSFRTSVDPKDETVVDISGGTIVGVIAADGSFKPPPPDPLYEAKWQLAEIDGEWRIESAADDLVMVVDDFNDSYRQLRVYFLDHSSSVVVPDLRYLPDRTSPVSMAQALMTVLLNGPSEQLRQAAHSEFDNTVRLGENVRLSDDKRGVKVDLTGVGTPDPQRVQAMTAQIRFTLQSVATRVDISFEGEPLPESTVNDLGSFDPEKIPGVGQSSSQAYLVGRYGNITDLSGSPIAGTAGQLGLELTRASMSAATGTIAAVATRNQQEQLYVGQPLNESPAQRPMQQALSADTLTLPSFNRAGDEVWTVRNGGTKPEVVRVVYTASDNGSFPTSPEIQTAFARVDSSELADIGEVTGLALSPDGVRVAIIADEKLWIGVIEYTDDPSVGNGAVSGNAGIATIAKVSPLRKELSDVKVVTWKDPQSLLVGAKSPSDSYRTVYEVSVDGRQRSLIPTADIFLDVEAISYVSGANPPLLAKFGGGDRIAADAFPAGGTGKIYQRDTLTADGVWTPLEATDTSRLPISARWVFYPN